jgi:4'-phosphopantetheinyl transferase
VADEPDLDRSIHVWRVSLATCPPHARALLSADERERADRFHFARDRDRFTVARATLRRVLGGYLGRAPDELVFAYSAHDKPSIDGVAFNLSHSNELALVAVTRGGEIGVDLEWHRPDIDVASLARSSFSAVEQRALFALPPAEQFTAFYRIWTRKESYIKAHGEGLSLPLDGFSVLADDSLAGWVIRDLAIDPGYSAALTITSPCLPVYWRAP